MRRLAVLVLVALSALPLSPAHAHATGAVPQIDKLITVGQLSIPRLKVTTTIYKGVTDTQFDRGVGFWPGTALPGTRGNVVIGGHRTAALRPFYSIETMKPGDLIKVTRPGRSFTYKVSRVMVVRPTALWIVKPTSTAMLTLFTCHPRGSTSMRYVVRATLVR
jgi:sortase A